MRLLVLAITFITVSCTSLNTAQKQELREWKAAGLAQEPKSEGLAAGLNILPGFGDFYNGNIGLGVVNLLAWPFSVLWAPVGGATGAEEVNYYITKVQVSKFEKNKADSQNSLLHAFTTQQINKDQYIYLNQRLNSIPLNQFIAVKEHYELMNQYGMPRNPAANQ